MICKRIPFLALKLSRPILLLFPIPNTVCGNPDRTAKILSASFSAVKSRKARREMPEITGRQAGTH